MIILVAVDRKGAIGKDNGLLYRVPEDLKNFKDHRQRGGNGQKDLGELPRREAVAQPSQRGAFLPLREYRGV